MSGVLLLMASLLILLTLLLYLSACNKPDEQPELGSELEAILIEHRNESVGIAAVILFPDRSKWETAIGYSDIGGLILDPNMQFCMASITKTFIAAQILLMESRNQLKLTDSISMHLDPLPNIPTEVSLLQLLNHTSGINNYVNHPDLFNNIVSNPTKIVSPEEIITSYVGPPSFSPGGGWEYSNTNYTLLGMIIEQISGESLGNALRK